MPNAGNRSAAAHVEIAIALLVHDVHTL